MVIHAWDTWLWCTVICWAICGGISQACDQTKAKTLSNFLRIVRLVEKDDSNLDVLEVANALRVQGYGGIGFDLFAKRWPWSDPDKLPGVSEEDDRWMQSAIGHSTKYIETGVTQVPAAGGVDTVAMGHVITGICAGLLRDLTLFTNTFFVGWYGGFENELDNLHAMTLAGDLGQTTLIYNGKMGPAGTWDDTNCPQNYTIGTTTTKTEATNAEIIGDIDGYLIGTIISRLLKEDTSLKLSAIIEGFYGAGIGRKKYKASDRAQLFKELVSDQRLLFESESFMYPYGEKLDMDDNAISAKLKYLPKTIDTFFKTFLTVPCGDFPKTHTMNYIIDVIDELQFQEQTSFRRMLGYVAGLSKYYVEPPQYKVLNVDANDKRGESFEWYVLADIMKPSVDGDTLREIGVLADNQNYGVTFGNVIIGILAGSKTSSSYANLLAITIAGGMLRYIETKPKPAIGKRGRWIESSCPRPYFAGNRISPTHSQVIGHIDGLILGYYVHSKQPRKLSTILTEYYNGNGIGGDAEVTSENRFDLVADIIKKMLLPGATLASHIEEICRRVVYSNDEELLILQQSDCSQYGTNAETEFNNFLSLDKQDTTDCKYGDINKLKPSGRSTTGVDGSNKAINYHMKRIQTYKSCFVRAGKTTGIHPALIAALASRETNVYDTSLLTADGYSKAADNDGYGMMQCDPASGLDCTKHPPDSCEHVIQVIQEILIANIKILRRRSSLKQWTDEQILQAGVASYNFGPSEKNIRTWSRLDIGTTGNDYSNDVVARAQWLIKEKGWTYCQGSAILEAKWGKLPSQGQLQNNYPAYPGSNGKTIKDDSDISDLVDSKYTPTDALRFSNMLNHISGHELDHRIAGSLVAENGQIYYDQARKLKSFLSDKYGFPESASSISKFTKKPGIVFAKDAGSTNGVIGLWDGMQAWGASDFTSSGVEFDLWATGDDCKLLAEKGDCEFYVQCLESRLQCGPDQYALAYGYKFCNKFTEFYGLFTEKGKKWVDDVRVCLMMKLYPIIKHPQLTCSKLMDAAFKSHVNCYVDSGFCGVIAQVNEAGKLSTNWDALVTILELETFADLGPVGQKSRSQIAGTVARCLLLTDASNAVEDAFDWAINGITDNIPFLTSQADQQAECESYAATGNCMFYECFNDKFPCEKDNGFSYILIFELPMCLELHMKANSFTSNGKAWERDYQKCMMAILLPLYKSDSINCGTIGLQLLKARRQCMDNANYCSIYEDNRWFLNLATEDIGYPMLLNRRSFTRPVSKQSDQLTNWYYRHLDDFKLDMGYMAGKVCP